MWCQSWSALEARCMRPVGVRASRPAVLCLALRQDVRGRGCVRRAVSVLLESTWATPENVWQLTCAPACTMDSFTNPVMFTQIITASGQWLCFQRFSWLRYTNGYFVLYIRYNFVSAFLVCSYCENGSMRCSSPEMSTLLSDLFYDDDLAPSRGTISGALLNVCVHIFL